MPSISNACLSGGADAVGAGPFEDSGWAGMPEGIMGWSSRLVALFLWVVKRARGKLQQESYTRVALLPNSEI